MTVPSLALSIGGVIFFHDLCGFIVGDSILLWLGFLVFRV